MNARRLQVLAWTLTVLVSVIAVIAWGQDTGWRLTELTIYQIFPLLGLLAFSIMWSHYVAAVARLHFKHDRAVLRRYFEATSLAVLGAILLHPGLLAWESWRSGFGLPPRSSLEYVAPDMRLYVVLGMTGLIIFLAYEFRRKFGDRPWWKYMASASDVAMILIFIHSIQLGSHLQTGWFRAIWYFYGLTLLGCLGYIYYQKSQAKRTVKP